MCKFLSRYFTGKYSFYERNKRHSKQEIAKINQQKEEELAEINKPLNEELEGEMPAPVTPINTQGTGINNTTPRIGLNL